MARKIMREIYGISIHSPHARGDSAASSCGASISGFQSTPLMRGETTTGAYDAQGGSDFNPLPSCEGRPSSSKSSRARMVFQSTPLMRGETLCQSAAHRPRSISIHSPHARGDLANAVCIITLIISIHSPHARGDVSDVAAVDTALGFQSTPLMRGETLWRSA